jgi:hypothetical protein
MARTIDEAFNTFLGRLAPNTTETTAASSHRAGIEQCLKSTFSMTSFFRSGSFGYGTSVSNYSDVDYFAVMPPNKLKQDSNASLRDIANTLRQRSPFSKVNVQTPAVVIPFGNALSERHEIIPAHFISTAGGISFYGIPNRTGGWMQSAPQAYGDYIDAIQARLADRVKPLIRLLKAWKYYNNVPIRSFYLELSVAEYAAAQTYITYKYDVRSALGYLFNSNLANRLDPFNSAENIYAGFAGIEIDTSLNKLQAAHASANYALNSENAGRTLDAFQFWDQVFNGNFPGYY